MWIISRALMQAYENLPCSRGQAAESSAGTCSDGAPSAPSSGSPTPRAYLSSGRTTDFSRLSRFGMTFAPLTDDLGAALLMWCQADSRARTSASQVRAQASPASGQDSGLKWRASLARFDPATSSWKTAQLCLLGDSELSSVTWPRSGMTQGGQCWELPMSERRTSATGSGLWPTPVASDTSSRNVPYQQGGTPLSLAVKKWPTPTAHNAKEGAHPSEYERNTPTLAAQAGGPLNPTWTEWLMGWPLGWTDLRPSATARFHFAPQPHSQNSRERLTEAA